MITKTAKVIHKLRVFFLFFIPFCFFLFLGLNPIDIGNLIKGEIGKAVGMSVGVPENQYNRLAMQLDAKQEQLDEREQGLNDLENKIIDSYSNQKYLFSFLLVGIVTLFFLVILNFYFDYKRRRELRK